MSVWLPPALAVTVPTAHTSVELSATTPFNWSEPPPDGNTFGLGTNCHCDPLKWRTRVSVGGAPSCWLSLPTTQTSLGESADTPSSWKASPAKPGTATCVQACPSKCSTNGS